MLPLLLLDLRGMRLPGCSRLRPMHLAFASVFRLPRYGMRPCAHTALATWHGPCRFYLGNTASGMGVRTNNQYLFSTTTWRGITFTVRPGGHRLTFGELQGVSSERFCGRMFRSCPSPPAALRSWQSERTWQQASQPRPPFKLACPERCLGLPQLSVGFCNPHPRAVALRSFLLLSDLLLSQLPPACAFAFAAPQANFASVISSLQFSSIQTTSGAFNVTLTLFSVDASTGKPSGSALAAQTFALTVATASTVTNWTLSPTSLPSLSAGSSYAVVLSGQGPSSASVYW